MTSANHSGIKSHFHLQFLPLYHLKRNNPLKTLTTQDTVPLKQAIEQMGKSNSGNSIQKPEGPTQISFSWKGTLCSMHLIGIRNLTVGILMVLNASEEHHKQTRANPNKFMHF